MGGHAGLGSSSGHGPASTKAGAQFGPGNALLFNPPRPTDEGKESPLLPPSLRQSKQLGLGSRFLNPPSHPSSSGQSHESTQLLNHLLVNQNNLAFQKPTRGGVHLSPDAGQKKVHSQSYSVSEPHMRGQ